jgi:hypothetical protein
MLIRDRRCGSCRYTFTGECAPGGRTVFPPSLVDAERPRPLFKVVRMKPTSASTGARGRRIPKVLDD